MQPNGRVSDLTIGAHSITPCSLNGTPLTGGFYIRDNTPATPGGLPIDPLINPNLLDTEYGRFNGTDVIGEPGSSSYWKRSYDPGTTVLPGVETIGSNNVAKMSVNVAPRYYVRVPPVLLVDTSPRFSMSL
jgi:hypothetical protein